MEDAPNRDAGPSFGPVPRIMRMLVEQRPFEVHVSAPGGLHLTEPIDYPILVDLNRDTQAIEAYHVRYLPLAPASPRGEARPDDENRGLVPAGDLMGAAALTVREVQVLNELAKGSSNKSIARALGISTGTVRVHVKSVLRKLVLDNRTQAAVWATATGMKGES